MTGLEERLREAKPRKVPTDREKGRQCLGCTVGHHVVGCNNYPSSEISFRVLLWLSLVSFINAGLQFCFHVSGNGGVTFYYQEIYCRLVFDVLFQTKRD